MAEERDNQAKAPADAAAQSAAEAETAKLRKRIDDLDLKLVELMNERAQVAVEVGRIKRSQGITQVYSPDREHQVLRHVAEANHGPLPERTLAAVWKELMSGSLALERPLKIIYLGPDGSFSHVAALQHFGSSVEYVPVADIASVFDWIEREHGDYGLVPIENSTAGSITDTLQKFLQTTVTVCAELAIPIHQNLLSNGPLAEIERVYSKPQVFDQCRAWLARNLPQAELVDLGSTTLAAQRAGTEPRSAAIASKMASELYALPIVCPAIEDNPGNVTRFLVLGRRGPKATGHDKTSLLFSVQDRKGALVEVLGVFEAKGLNMTRIESHPSPTGKWEYYFFVDLEGHREDAAMREALAEAKNHCRRLEVLGSYPRAVTNEEG